MKSYSMITGFLIVAMIFQACDRQNMQWKLNSPDGKLQVIVSKEKLNDSNFLYYSVLRKTSGTIDTILYQSPLGIERKDQSFRVNLKLSETPQLKKVIDNYTLSAGKQKSVHAEANELILSFVNPMKKPIQLVFRAYNDGIGFRYRFPGQSDSIYTVTKEYTGFAINLKGKAWLLPYDKPGQWTPAHENYYRNGIEVGVPAPGEEGWCFPALFNTGKNWILISETGVYGNYCASHLQPGSRDGMYTIRYPEPTDGNGTGQSIPSWKLPWVLPWRTIMIGETPGIILESMMTFNLADSSRIADPSWIKPGRASWSWWSDHASSMNYQSLKSYIDLAAVMGWEYSLVDAGWDIMKGGSIEQLVKYANSKGIGILMWYNSGGPHNIVKSSPREIMFNPETRKAEFKKLHQWGVKGVKVDFWQSDKQHIIQLYQDVLKDAADEKILVNFHGCTLPRGWARTWPNLMSMEAVKGAEAYSFDAEYPGPATYINTILPFTRNVVGSMDYTPVTFTNQLYPHLTSWGHELALSVIFESGILHFADRASAYLGLPVEPKNFLKNVPVAWDETRYLLGEPGQYLVLSRRSGESWYIAGISGLKEPKEIELDLSFIHHPNTTYTLISDGENNKSFASNSAPFNKSDKFRIKMLTFGGFVMVVK
jgi:alpha-glucosidase